MALPAPDETSSFSTAPNSPAGSTFAVGSMRRAGVSRGSASGSPASSTSGSLGSEDTGSFDHIFSDGASSPSAPKGGRVSTAGGGKVVRLARKKRRRPLPPGQKLLRLLGITALLALGQAVVHPLNGPCENAGVAAPVQVQLAAPFALTTPLVDLRTEVENVCQVKKLTPGVFVIDPKSGAYLDYAGTQQFSAASMIKVPVLVALLNAIDHGDIDPKKILAIKAEHVGGGSGHLQWRPLGTKLPLMDVAELMIIISDNTATNMIIDLLGGKDVVNKKFQQWGLKNTVINNPLPDLTGTNKTSPYDLVYLLARVERGELMADAWRQRMRQIMERTKTRTLINQGLPPGAKLAHKTGDIGSMVGDTGVITTPDGRRLIMAMQVQRPHNDRRANELIRKVTGIVYNGFERFKALQPVPAKKPAEIKTEAQTEVKP